MSEQTKGPGPAACAVEKRHIRDKVMVVGWQSHCEMEVALRVLSVCLAVGSAMKKSFFNVMAGRVLKGQSQHLPGGV